VWQRWKIKHEGNARDAGRWGDVEVMKAGGTTAFLNGGGAPVIFDGSE
jgi:hypothetical protein